MRQPSPSGLRRNPRVLSLNAQEKRSKRARLLCEVCAAGNAEAAQRMWVYRGQLTEKGVQMLKLRIGNTDEPRRGERVNVCR